MNTTIGPKFKKIWVLKKHYVDINRHIKVLPVLFQPRARHVIHIKKLLEFEIQLPLTPGSKS